jgi:hypothetical protein
LKSYNAKVCEKNGSLKGFYAKGCRKLIWPFVRLGWANAFLFAAYYLLKSFIFFGFI